MLRRNLNIGAVAVLAAVACTAPEPGAPGQGVATVTRWGTPVDSADTAPIDTAPIDTAPPDDTADTADTAPSVPEHLDPTWTMSAEISTVGVVTWTTHAALTSWVEFGPDTTYGHTTGITTTSGTEHRVVVAGLTPEHTWHWRAVSSSSDGVVSTSDDFTVTTGSVPDYVPTLTASGTSTADGYIVTSVLNKSDETSLLILNMAGVPVWWRKSESTESLSRIRLTTDGQYIEYDDCEIIDADGHSQCWIRKVSLDQTEDTSVLATSVSHDFVASATGGYAYVAKDIRIWTDPSDGEDKQVAGDSLTVVDSTGDPTVVWSSWRDLTVDITNPESWDGESWDWTHCNSIQAVDALSAWVVSCKLINTVFFLSYSGDILYQVGGADSDLALTGGTASDGQHYAWYTGDTHSGTLSMFDNRITTHDARLVSYAVDFDSLTYAESWSYDPPTKMDIDARGSFVPLPDGNILASWGSANLITQLTPDGTVLWSLDTGGHGTVGYTEWAGSLGGATEP